MDLRGKDCSPISTVEKVKNILETLGLTTKETKYDSKENGVLSGLEYETCMS